MSLVHARAFLPTCKCILFGDEVQTPGKNGGAPGFSEELRVVSLTGVLGCGVADGRRL